MSHIDVNLLSRPRVVLIVSRSIIARAAIDGDAEDAFAFLQVVEARVYQAVAVVLARGFCLCQSLGIRQRYVV